MKNIVLVGFMGTGKTSVGKALAERLGTKFVDADDLIEEDQKMPITRIFKEKGEPYFREIEKRIIKRLSGEDGLVIAAGGGAVLFEENVNNLRKNGAIFCLTASAQVILERTRHYSHRPLLNVEDPRKKIEELLAFRAPYYERAADYTIDTSQFSVDEVTDKIADALKSEEQI